MPEALTITVYLFWLVSIGCIVAGAAGFWKGFRR
jgi:hypothetical protein